MAKKTKFSYEYKPTKSAITDDSIHDGFATAAFGTALVGFATVILFLAAPDIVVPFALYHRWLEAITWVTGFGGIMLATGTVFHGRARQKASAVLFSIAALAGLALVLYVDYFRPDLAIPNIFDEIAQFEAFRMNIAAMAAITIGLSILGVILASVSIKRNGL
jgi:hypothetical protein